VSKNYSLEVLTSLSIDKFKNNNMVEKNFESEKSSFEPPLPPLVDAKKKKKLRQKRKPCFCVSDGFSDESKRLFMEFVKCVKS
jgi:FMN phosphatase YigB (HAD superfamily)